MSRTSSTVGCRNRRWRRVSHFCGRKIKKGHFRGQKHREARQKIPREAKRATPGRPTDRPTDRPTRGRPRSRARPTVRLPPPPESDATCGAVGRAGEVRANYRRPSLPFGMRAVNPRSDELSFWSATLFSATRSNSCRSRMCVDSRLTVRFVECRHR